MGISVELQDEPGQVIESIEDIGNLLPSILPPLPPSENGLTHIERYGDTTFNRLQMTPFIKAWESLTTSVSGAEQAAFMVEVMRLAHRCQSESSSLR